MAAKRREEAATAASNPPVRRSRAAEQATPDSVMAAFQKEKKYNDSVRRLGDNSIAEGVEAITTGSVKLDRALAVGGFARKRISEIYGPESGGKTTLALQVVANCQRAGGVAVFVDAEHALDPSYARQLGINVDDLVVVRPDSGEEGLGAIEDAVNAGADLVVVDSVAALVPEAELAGDYGDSLPGLQARMMSQGMRKLTGIIGKSRAAVIFINQIREKIGVQFGSSETQTGGRALKFYSSQRVDIRRIGAANAGKDEGNRVRAKVVKNKVGPPFREAEFDLLFGIGTDAVGEVLEMAIEAGLVEQSGSWYSFEGERLGQGAATVANELRENPDWFEKIRAAVMKKLDEKPEADDATPAEE